MDQRDIEFAALNVINIITVYTIIGSIDVK